MNESADNRDSETREAIVGWLMMMPIVLVWAVMGGLVSCALVYLMIAIFLPARADGFVIFPIDVWWSLLGGLGAALMITLFPLSEMILRFGHGKPVKKEQVGKWLMTHTAIIFTIWNILYVPYVCHRWVHDPPVNGTI